MMFLQHPHQERVISEERELNAKLQDLREFYDTETYKSLPSEEKVLIHRQHEAMFKYLSALRERIGYWICRSA